MLHRPAHSIARLQNVWLGLGLLLLGLLFFADEASADTLVSGRITSTTWTEANSPYRVTGTVTVNGVLTIQPGVTVLFDHGTQLRVGEAGAAGITGSLNAQGNATHPIVFTPTSGLAGGWSGLSFQPQNSASSTIRHAVIEKSGVAIWNNVRSGLTLENVVIHNGTGSALSDGGGSVTMRSTTIRDNAGGIQSALNSGLTLQDVTMTNVTGTPVQGGFGQSFTNVLVDGQPPAEIRVVGGTATSPTVATAAIPYRVTASVTVSGVMNVQPGVTLRFDPGVQLKMGSAGAAGITGSLNAQGNATHPILFTSANGAVGGWTGLVFQPQNTVTSTIRYVTIEKAGTTLSMNSPASLTLEHALLRDGAGSPFTSTGSAAIRSTTIRDHPGGLSFGLNAGLTLQDVTILNASATPILGGFGQSFTNVLVDGQAPTEIRVVGGTATNPTAATAPIPYRVRGTVTVSGTMNVQPGVTLHFDPGVQLRFGEAGAPSITGALNAQGTAAQPILFTAANGVPGGWGGLSFQPQNTASSTIRHATIEKSGTLVWTTVRAILTMEHVVLQNSTTQAVGDSGASVTLRSTLVRDGPGGLNMGITSSLTLQDVTISNSSATPVRGGFGQSFTNVLIDGQPASEIRVVGGRALSPTVATTPLPYTVTAGVTVSGVMTVQPGVTIRFDPGVLLRLGEAGAPSITGSMNALGTAAQPILLTATNGLSGGWTGIYALPQNSATSTLRHVILEKGEGFIAGTRATLNVESSILRNASIHDISCPGGVVSVTRTVFQSPLRGATLSGCASFTARDSAFLGQSLYALSANQTQVADAKINYWDAADGPSGIGAGSGRAAWGNVLYAPYITGVPTPPTGLVATGGVGEVSLSWSAPTSVGTIFRYEVFRATSPGDPGVLIATTADGNVLSYRDAGLDLVPGATYHYKVRGVNIVGPGAFSDETSGAARNAAGSNVIVPRTEALYPVTPGAQVQNGTSLVSLTNLDSGGLICDTSGSAPKTPNAQTSCIDGRTTKGGEYDGDLTTWTNLYNRLAPVNATCGTTGIQTQARAPSNATYYLSGPRVVEQAQLVTRAMPGLGNYDKMCAALYVQDAATGAWAQVVLRNGFSGPSQVYTDTATFPARTITGVMLVAEWNQLVFSNPPGGWMGVNVLDVRLPAAGVRVTHPAEGATYDANVAAGYATTATAETSGAWDRVEYRLGSPTGPLLAAAHASPWQADLTVPEGAVTLCAVAHKDAGGSSAACSAFTVRSTAPGAPAGLQAEAGQEDGTVHLSWASATPAPGHPVAGYRVYRGAASGGPYAPIGSTTGLGFLDTDLPTGTHHYVVRAVNGANVEGPASGEASAAVVGTTLADGFTLAKYRPESPTGNTPFGGLALKPTFPGGAGGPTVDLANGELVAPFPLLHVDEHLGDDFAFSLTFRSIGNAAGNRSLAPRWDANWLQALEPDGADLLLHTGDGRVLRFAAASGGWEGPAGSYARITEEGGLLELRDRHGGRRAFDPAKGHALTDAYDAAGNRWALAYGPDLSLQSITDPSGRVATLTYDAGRLAGVADWAGRTAALRYDEAGRLVAMATPGPTAGTSHVTRFGYDADGRLASVRDPLHQEYVRIDYDAHGRVVAQRAAAGADAFFQHHHDAGVTFARDGLGNKVEWRFLSEGAPRVVPSAKIEHTRGLRPTDPANHTTTYAHNAQDERTGVTYPAGNGATYVYDEASPSFFSRGNLLSETRTPGLVPPSPLQSTSLLGIVTLYTYDPVCNKPTTIVDARGTDSSFVPPNGGSASAARYTTTVAYNAACQPVSIQRPTVNPAGLPDAAFTGAYAGQPIVETFTYNAAGQLVTYTDPMGVNETRAYHPAPSSPGKPAGYLRSVTVDAGASPRLNLETTYEYTDFGVVSKVTDPRGDARAYAVDLRGRTTQETGPAVGSPPAGIRTQWTYDANDDVLSLRRETDPGSGAYATTEYAYDALGQLVSETVRPTATTAITTRYAYDGDGNLVRRTGGGGEARTWTYDERGLLLSRSGPDGGTYAYDPNGNLKTHVDPLGNASTYVYDGYDRLAVATDAKGSQFATGYDPVGNVVAQRGVGGTSGRILYERAFDHDEADRTYRQREWLQSADTMPLATGTLGVGGRWVTTLREHDPRGLVNRTIDDNGNVTTHAYDAAGRPVSTRDPTDLLVQATYDKGGNVVQVKQTVAGATLATCPHVCATTYAYDAEGRLTATTNPDGTTRTVAYDGRGNVVRTTDEAGRVVLHAYDLADRPTQTRRAMGGTPTQYVTTTTVWDDEGRVQARCDHGGNCTTYTYVPATTLVASETPPGSTGYTKTYDAAGDLRTVAYASGRTVALGYDPLHRPVMVLLSGGANAMGTTFQTFAYDDMGRLTRATDDGLSQLGTGLAKDFSNVELRQRFDTLGRVIEESQLGLSVKHTLDGVGNVRSTTYPDPAGRVVSRSHDGAGRLDRAWDDKGLLVDYGYQGGLVARKDLGGPRPTPPAEGAASPVAQTLVTHDAAQRPVRVKHGFPDGWTQADVTTRFSPTGDRLAQKLEGGNGGSDHHSQLWQLDGLGRATAWKRGPLTSSSPTSPLDTIASPMQNRSWSEIDGTNDWRAWDVGGTTCTRSTSMVGSPALRQVDDACPTASTAYAYDADGNLVSDGEHTYRWDRLNRLVRVETPAGDAVVGYAYDAFGRRVVKIFPGSSSDPGPHEGWYTFVGQHLVQEAWPNGMLQLPPGFPPVATGYSLIRQWTYGPGVDEVLTMDTSRNGGSVIEADDARHFYAHDSAGNVLGLLDKDGRLVEGYAYQPYGQVTILVPGLATTLVSWNDFDDVARTDTYGSDPTARPYSPNGNPWFFTGRQYDPEVGLYNYRARHYHPTLGQFMSADPIGTWGDPNNLGNPYAYVGNNPGSYRDPSGLYAGVDDLAACGGGALLAVGVRGVMDVWNREFSGWDYAGEVTGGCAGGTATLYGGPIAGGAVYGAVSSGTNYGIHALQGTQEASLSSFATEVGIGTVTGAAGGAVAKGVGKVATTALRQSESVALRKAADTLDLGLHPQKGPLSVKGRFPDAGTWAKPQTLDDHFARHASELGVKTEKAYVREAGKLFERAARGELPAKADGVSIRVYDPNADVFGSYTMKGGARTLYRPDPALHAEKSNWQYWLKQPGDRWP